MPRHKSQVPRLRVGRLRMPLLALTVFVLATGCEQDQDGDGWTIQDGDCDDAAAEVHPEATEVCNGTDDDCDELIDADDPSLAPWYRDSDGDGRGSTDQSVRACPAPAGYVAQPGDCNDTDPTLYPGALERCDGQDNDCDLLVDGEDPDTLEYPNDGVDNDCDGHEAVLIQVAAGSGHSLALDDVGEVWAWGSNLSGELGDGSKTDRRTPVHVGGLCEVAAIEAGGSHSLALCRDGTVWAWGSNYYGQLGVGSSVQESTVPVKVSGLYSVTAISAGSNHSLALLEDGTVSAWGYGLGCGNSTYDVYRPTSMTGVANVSAVAGGSQHSLALLRDGTVMAWGANYHGQLGIGTTSNFSPPVQVAGLSNARRVAAGANHSLALLADGTVKSWGDNYSGQLGDGTTTDRTLPVSVSGLTNVTAISGGGDYSLVLLGNGTMQAWGYNNKGQLGDGTTTNRTTPVRVLVLDDVVQVSAGGIHTLAVHRDGSAWACGNNSSGELGDGTGTMRTTPVPVSVPGP